MEVLKSPLFLLCCFLFILHQLLQKVFDIPLPIIDKYLDALLAMPVILTLLLAEKQWLFKKGPLYRLTKMEVIVTTIYIVAVTELLFPVLSPRFSADVLDVLLYAIGSFTFYHTINKKVD